MFVLRHKNMIYVYNELGLMNRAYERAQKGSEIAYMQSATYVLEMSDEYRDSCRVLKDRYGVFVPQNYHNTEKILKMIKILMDT
jgi:hypothetical protein